MHRRNGREFRVKVFGECTVRIQSFAGEMLARRRVGVRVGWGTGDTTETEGVVLTGHTQGFPRVLLGRRTLERDENEVGRSGKGGTGEFGRWPGMVGRCADAEGDAMEERQVYIGNGKALHGHGGEK
jgi:hypothetical protein